ncbi:MAG: ATP-binding protein, partial [Actinomycetota bacterium]|nr:ATP-binding protein [Actinomycetota bacterium]
GYHRVRTVLVPDVTVIGAAAADCVHLLAELIDNALRYSAPTEPVRVVAGLENDGGVVVEVVDVGLGVADSDLRMANMRLAAGGEFSPENARHMGLFVISRLAHRHGIEVRLFPASPGSRGTTAEVYLPPHLLSYRDTEEPAPPQQPMVTAAVPDPPEAYQAYQPDEPQLAEPYEFPGAPEPYEQYEPYEEAPEPGPGPVVSLLPRRTPGSSGITGVPAGSPVQSPADDETGRERRELPQPWWEADEQAAHRAAAPGADQRLEPAVDEYPDEHVEPEPVVEKSSPADTSAYFAARSRARGAAEEDTGSAAAGDTDTIYQRMLSESLGNDPNEPGLRADLDWQSVWDRGWSVAAEVENMPVAAHTEHGLPVREPGARLVPGSAEAEPPPAGSDPSAHHRDDTGEPVTSNGGPAHEAQARDPAAIRSSISSHFGGVRAARSHARDNGFENDFENDLDTDQGQNQQ